MKSKSNKINKKNNKPKQNSSKFEWRTSPLKDQEVAKHFAEQI